MYGDHETAYAYNAHSDGSVADGNCRACDSWLNTARYVGQNNPATFEAHSRNRSARDKLHDRLRWSGTT